MSQVLSPSLIAVILLLPGTVSSGNADAPKDPLADLKAAFDAGDDTRVIELAAALPENPEAGELAASAHQRRGIDHFYAARIDASVADFDAFLARHPERAPYHWQRGISLYYAGRFVDGVRQFEIHQDVNSQDVENAIFHFICAARSPSIGLEKARANFISITADTRIPMPELHALFAGTGSEKSVLAAAGTAAGETRANALCYAHLYLGLYHEALGNADKSLAHNRKAATDYAQDHYMGQVAKVHLKLRTASSGSNR